MVKGHHLSVWNRKCIICKQGWESNRRDHDQYIAVFGEKEYIGFLGPVLVPLAPPPPSYPHGYQVHRTFYNRSSGKVKKENMVMCRLVGGTRGSCLNCMKTPMNWVAHHICLHPDMSYFTLWRIARAGTPWFPSPEAEKALLKPSRKVLQECFKSVEHFGVDEWRRVVCRVEQGSEPGPPPAPGTYMELMVMKAFKDHGFMKRFLALPEDLFCLVMWEHATDSALGRLSIALQYDIEVRRRCITAPNIKSAHVRNLWDPIQYSDDSDKGLTSRGKKAMSQRLCFNFFGQMYQPFITAGQFKENSTVRIQVDHNGIRTVEVLDNHPKQRERRRLPGIFYIVECMACLCRDYQIYSQGPFLRLKEKDHALPNFSRIYAVPPPPPPPPHFNIPPNFHHLGNNPAIIQTPSTHGMLRLWDIDNPPPCGGFATAGNFQTKSSLINSLDFRNATGLTVFCTHNNTFAMHAHQDNDTALKTWQTLTPRQQAICFCIHLPLSSNELIQEVWIWEIRSSTGILKGRIIEVASTTEGQSRAFGALNSKKPAIAHRLLFKENLTNLFYEQPPLDASITWFSARTRRGASELPRERRFTDSIIRTSATLQNISSVSIYSDIHGATTGLSFHYTNNTTQSIGQRRLGFAGTKETIVHEPVRMSIWDFALRSRRFDESSFTRDCVRIRFERKGEQDGGKSVDDEVRECRRFMLGKNAARIVFWELEDGKDRVKVEMNSTTPWHVVDVESGDSDIPDD